VFEGIVFILKGIILTEVLTNALRSWGIFDLIRNKVKQISFFHRLLDCFECTSVWVGFFVVCYLLLFEVTIITYALILHRLACFLHCVLEWMDATRAKREGEI
jgi:hypothetical protein